ncbi:MAG: hypothetical protein ACLT76_05670 [Clostridium fessum]
MKVFPTTDDVNRFKKLKKAYIDTGKEKMPVTVEQVRFFKNMVILKFKEMNRIEDCEPFRNKDILITRDQCGRNRIRMRILYCRSDWPDSADGRG